ncbi:beta-glucuronidase [Paenibacillus sp. J5C_2022]|uniref:glycoside hydrolase family 2 protein n=1 Tax=Paenibacillus sp. J5C2022 TaxID=2977129 RepID=UPI0021D281F6|nr:glycoside hydrolase family 2 TIM barrel-domain containing protein [Paenibacillus sp. J5C2022]MCU6709076.1 beta-glucuronidase [Paenibacillus sp. J5C2022]
MRTFKQHHRRQTVSLNGLWQFRIDPDGIGEKAGWFARFPSESDAMPVPGCWNNEIGYYNYEGAAWYRTSFVLVENRSIRLLFGAVLGYAKVYMDSVLVAEHEGGFTPFQCILHNVPPGKHELIIRTDNTSDDATVPYRIVDWHHYGGIHRSVELQLLPDHYIHHVKIDYSLNDALTQAALSIETEVVSLSSKLQQVPLQVRIGEGDMVLTETTSLQPGESRIVRFTCTMDDIALWQVGKPALYTISVSTDQDDYIDRIGFRKIEVADGQVLVNGQPLYMQGVNRHEEHPEWGFAFPEKLMKKDLDIIEQAGCNSIRGAHYPQNPYWLDLLDERGIVYWAEVPVWGAHMPVEVFANSVYQEKAAIMMEEMIRRDYHHPSILFWSAHNEIDTRTKEAYQFSELMVNRIRKLDHTRLVAYASHFPMEDIVMDLFDVIGINKYDGWYRGDVEEFQPFLEQFETYSRQHGGSDKPWIMTEFGAAGIYGDTGWEPRLFSEDYQAHVVETALRIFRRHKRIQGTFVWQFADVRADLHSDKTTFRDRARGFNNKGIVNEYRKPKLAYRAVQRVYREQRDNEH